MSLATLSPHLDGTLRRKALVSDYINAVFMFSIQIGGARERDYQREEGASYNPRPARVALILIEECEVTDHDTLAAGMLCAVCEADQDEVQALPGLTPRTRTLAALAAQPMYRLLAADSDPDAIRIALAVMLDRARHIHLAPAANPTAGSPLAEQAQTHTIRQQLVADFLAAQTHAEKLAPKLAAKIAWWVQRNNTGSETVSRSVDGSMNT